MRDTVGWKELLPTYPNEDIHRRDEPTYPHAVMIHFHDTPMLLLGSVYRQLKLSDSDPAPLASLAVVGSWWLWHLTFPTISLPRIDIDGLGYTARRRADTVIPVVGNPARVRKARPGVADQ